MSLLSGGGVGVGDSLDTLDTGLVLATCRSAVSRYTVLINITLTVLLLQG